MSRIALCAVAMTLVAGCGSSGGGAADLAAADLAVVANEDLAGGGVDGMAGGDLSSISQCNNLTLAGTPTVPVSYVATGAPSFSGGTIAAGTYFITSGTFYTGAGGMTGSYGTFRGVYRFNGATLDLLASTPQGLVSETATVTTTGNSITMSPTCGGQGPSQELYSATTTSFSIGTITGSIGLALGLTKQ